MQSHDDYVLNGRWHKCVCGAMWSDSDGGPCHGICQEIGCDAITEGEYCEEHQAARDNADADEAIAAEEAVG